MQSSHVRPRPWHLLAFSAQTLAELNEYTSQLGNYIRQHPEQSALAITSALSTKTPTQAMGRMLVYSDRADLLAALATEERAITGTLPNPKKSNVAFLFPGLGEHYVAMAQEIYQTEPVFRKWIDTCSAHLKPLLDVDLCDVLYPQNEQALSRVASSKEDVHQKLDLRRMLNRGQADDESKASSPLQQTALAQPATFVVEYALAQLWISWGMRPDALFGYSIGEYVAACLAGVFSLPEALYLVARRAQLIQTLPEGAMLAIPLPEKEIAPLLNSQLSLSAVNGASLCVVAGSPDAIESLQTQLLARQQPAVRIQAQHAFHSHMMHPIAEEFENLVKACSLQPPQIPYISNVTGTWITPEDATRPSYWVAHLCQPVRAADGLQTLWHDPRRVLLEVGPGQTLCSLALQNAPANGAEYFAFPSLKASYDPQPDTTLLLNTLGRLWLTGIPIQWQLIGDGGQEMSSDQRQQLLAALASTAQAANNAQTAPASQDCQQPPKNEPQKRARPHLFSAYAAPEGEMEATLVHLWQDTLQIAPIGINDNFFELGGHSLLALHIISQLSQKVQGEIPLSLFFEHPTIAQLAHALTPSQPTQSTSPAQAPRESSQQEQTHFLSYLLPNGLEITHQNKAETDHFYEDIFEHRSYIRHLATLPEKACVFDVGANIGLFSLFIHTLGKQATIYAFEPSPPTFEILQRNISAHQVNAHLFNIGLSDRERTATFTFYPKSSGMSTVYGDREEERAVLKAIMDNQIESGMAGMELVSAYSDELLEERLKSLQFSCQLRPLSQIIQEQKITHIDLMKIDVQKSELDVLRGIAADDWNKIASIVMEVHDTENRLQTVAQLLQSHGYRVEIQQDELYKGSVIYLVYANR